MYLNERYSIAIKLARHAFTPKLQTNRLRASNSHDEEINDENHGSPL